MENNSSFSRLRELRGSGYEIVDGEPDIIGWSIRDNTDHKLGVVQDLLFEPEIQKVRYIIAHLKDNDYDLDKRKVLIPIGVAELQENGDNVILNAVSPWQIRALPTYYKEMNSKDEQEIYTIFSTTYDTTTLDNTPQGRQHMYDHANYNYDNLFRNRRKDKLKNNPPDTPFAIRERGGNTLDTTNTRDYESQREYHEADAMAVRNKDAKQDEFLRQDETKRERLIERIKHMKDDLNEIERDLREGRHGI